MKNKIPYTSGGGTKPYDTPFNIRFKKDLDKYGIKKGDENPHLNMKLKPPWVWICCWVNAGEKHRTTAFSIYAMKNLKVARAVMYTNNANARPV